MISMTSIERTLAEVVVGIILLFGTVMYLEHRGAQSCLNAEAAVVTQAETRNTQVETAGKIDNAKTEATYDAMLHSPIGALPSVAGLQPQACPGPVPSPRPSPSKGPSPAPVRTEPPPSVVPESWSPFERSDVQASRDADAEVIYLQGLLRTQFAVCTSKVQ